MRFALFIFLFLFTKTLAAQNDSTKYWHNEIRTIHYKPQGRDFVCVNPTRRFNRALYGTHTAFRLEAGDVPEFAMYMPGMGGLTNMAIDGGAATVLEMQLDASKELKSLTLKTLANDVVIGLMSVTLQRK